MFIYQILPLCGGIFLPLQAGFSLDSNRQNWPCEVIKTPFSSLYWFIVKYIVANLTNIVCTVSTASVIVFTYMTKNRHVNPNLVRFVVLYCLTLSRTYLH